VALKSRFEDLASDNRFLHCAWQKYVTYRNKQAVKFHKISTAFLFVHIMKLLTLFARKGLKSFIMN